MHKLFKKTLSIPLFISLLLTLLYSQVASAENSAFERINTEGVLVVGMSGEQPPFNFVSNLETVIGYDVELAAALAKSMKVDVRIELMPFSELMGALKKQKIDVIISGFSFTEQRSQKVTFVGPYALSGKTLLITKKRLKEIKASTGFNHETVHLMALENSTSQTLAKEHLGKAKLTAVKHYKDALLTIRSGEADALIADLAVCDLAVIHDTLQTLTTLQKPLAIEEISMAINKNEPLLASRLSIQLAALTKSDTLKKLHDKWFNNPSWLALLP